jgi:hypothetical protein
MGLCAKGAPLEQVLRRLEGLAERDRVRWYELVGSGIPALGAEEPFRHLPVVIEPLPDGRGLMAHLVAPLPLSAQGSTGEEAERRLAALLQQRLQEGIELRALTVPLTAAAGSEPGWLPDDEWTREWLQEVEAYRVECDAADRARLDPAAPQESAS